MSDLRLSEHLLMGSSSLTAECEDLVEELRVWVQHQIYIGRRPIPLQCALRIVSEQLGDAWGEGGFAQVKGKTDA
ncbi:MAG: hypothetical protein KDK24_20305 [Pseudooceanicola sp.]|nr:hypothetical protein [Pseudooceanicola sp.]